MSIFRALHTLNAVEAGALTSVALESMLADPARYSEWQTLSTMQGQIDRMWGSDITIDAILGSGRALRAMASVRGKHFYDAEYLKFLSPNAWAVLLPDTQDITIAAAGGISGWANALGDPAKDFVNGTVASQPIPDIANSPIYGQPVVNFVSSDTLTSTGVPSANGAPYTIFFVYRRATAAASGYMSGTSINIGFGNSAAGDATAMNSVLGTFNNSAGAVGAWAMSRFRRSGVNLFHSLNGGAESAPLTSATNIPELITAQTLGRGVGSVMTGQMAEVWIVAGNSDAASVEIQRITTMLKNKYGL